MRDTTPIFPDPAKSDATAPNRLIHSSVGVGAEGSL
jgi:hypothetical protein